MKRWIAMGIVALIATPLAAQVETKSGGIIIKKVIKNGKVVTEDVEVFGDLDEDDAKRYLKRLGKKPKSSKGKKSKRAKKSKRKSSRDALILRWNGEDHALDLGTHLRDALKDLHREGGPLHGLRGLPGHLEGMMKRPEMRQFKLELKDMGRDLHEQLEDALGDLKQHGIQLRLAPGSERGHVFKLAPKVFRYRAEKRDDHHDGDDGDDDDDSDDKGAMIVEFDVDTGAVKAKAKSKKSSKSRVRARRKASDTDGTIERLESQIRALRSELHELKRGLGRPAVKKTSNDVWL